ncbi:MAG: glycosyl hydrolase, partial [Candidatus Aminicenantales bacterium]
MSARSLRSLLVVGLIGLAACGRGPSSSRPAGGGAPDALATGFAHPPDSARPWTYWMWMDGNLNREGITADLESMRAAGLGG